MVASNLLLLNGNPDRTSGQGLLSRIEPKKTTTGGVSDSYIDPSKATVEGRMTNLMQQNNPYMERARYRGLAFANRRGMPNSSIAAGASEAAAIDAALPIAQQDAGLYGEEALSAQGQQYKLAENQQMNQLSKELATHEGGIRGDLINLEYGNRGDLENLKSENEIKQIEARYGEEAAQLASKLGQDTFRLYSVTMSNLDTNRLNEIAFVQNKEGMTTSQKENAIAQINATYQQAFAWQKDLFEQQANWKWEF